MCKELEYLRKEQNRLMSLNPTKLTRNNNNSVTSNETLTGALSAEMAIPLPNNKHHAHHAQNMSSINNNNTLLHSSAAGIGVITSKEINKRYRSLGSTTGATPLRLTNHQDDDYPEDMTIGVNNNSKCASIIKASNMGIMNENELKDNKIIHHTSNRSSSSGVGENLVLMMNDCRSNSSSSSMPSARTSTNIHHRHHHQHHQHEQARGENELNLIDEDEERILESRESSSSASSNRTTAIDPSGDIGYDVLALNISPDLGERIMLSGDRSLIEQAFPEIGHAIMDGRSGAGSTAVAWNHESRQVIRFPLNGFCKLNSIQAITRLLSMKYQIITSHGGGVDSQQFSEYLFMRKVRQ